MTYLNDEIMGVPGLSGTNFQRQQQLYEKGFGSPMGPYQGSMDQNLFLLAKIRGGQYGSLGQPAAPITVSAPAAPAIQPAPQGAPLPKWAPQQLDWQSQYNAAKEAAGNALGDFQNFLGGQGAKLAEFNQRFQSAIPNILQETSQKYGIPNLQQVSSNASDAVTALRNRITELTTGQTSAGAYFTSAGQYQRALENGIMPRYQEAQELSQTAEKQLLQAQGLAQSEYATRLAPYQTEAQTLSEQMSREATGYTATMGKRLDALLALPGLTLDQQKEADLLASKEQEYENQRVGFQKQLEGAQARAQAEVQAAGLSAEATKAAAGAEALSRVKAAGLGQGLIQDEKGNWVPITGTTGTTPGGINSNLNSQDLIRMIDEEFKKLQGGRGGGGNSQPNANSFIIP